MKKILPFLIMSFLCISATFAQTGIPEGYVSVYSVNAEVEKAPIALAAVQSYQVLGPANGWGTAVDHDFSKYEKLVFKISFNAADAGKQVAARMSVNTVVKLAIITLPLVGTNYLAEVDIKEYADSKGLILFGGIVFYNGATHWTFTYDGVPASNATTIEYVALKKSTSTGLNEIRIVDPNALVNVYSITGAIIRKNVKISEATIGLKHGLYIVDGRKVVVNK